MAKLKVYHPPPNWPAPPTGWRPPAGWQPDPGWGPAPEGWQFWTEERANPFGCLFGVAGAGVLLVLVVVVGTIVRGEPPSGYAAGELLGQFLMAGVVTGVIAYFWGRPWKLWVYPLIALAVGFGLSVIRVAGQQAGTGG